MARTRRLLTPEATRLLDAAAEADAELAVVLRQRDDYARRALGAGATLREVGAAIGMSPQAAHKRFNGEGHGQT
jgi:hypothetical protein